MDVSALLTAASKEQRLQNEIERLVKIAGWRDKPFMMGLLKLCLRSGNMEPILEQLKRRFKDAASFHPFEDVPPPDSVGGEISIGHLVLPDWTIGAPVGISLEHLPTHILICGPSGKGKTILARYLALQIVNFGIPILVPDTEESFEDLPLYAPGRILTFDVSKGEFKRNIWQPLPGETFMDTESRLRDMFREVWVGEGGINILSEVAIELHKENGVFTLSQFYERLKKMRSRRGLDWRRGQYLESLINRVSNLVNHLSAGYEVLEGYPLDSMLSVSMVLNMQNLSNDINVFFVVELLSAISDLKMRQRAESLPLVAIIDEAQRFLEAAGYSGTVVGSPAMFDIIATLRKRNAGLLLATQLVSKLPDVVLGNVSTQIFFQTLDGDSISKIGKSLSLSQGQQKFLPELPKRCVLMRHPNFPKPFLVKIPELNLECTATEEQIAEMMEPIIASLKWKPSPFANDANQQEAASSNKASVERNIASHVTDDMECRDADAETTVKTTKLNTVLQGLAKNAVDYLEGRAKNPFVGATQGDKEQGISPSVGNARREKLSKSGFIELHKIQLVPHGGATTLVEITDKGLELLKEIRSKVKPPPGRGSFIHKFWQDKVASHFRTCLPGATVSIEDGDGKAVDVLVRNGNETIGIEISISTRPEDELRNLINDFNFCDRVIVLAETETHLAEIMKLAESEFGADCEKITTAVLNEFINSPLAQGATLT